MDGNPKQLIVDKVKNSTNILVTVSRNPSVDELAAALGFTLMLNKMDKHATAVFSGQIPPAISFLEPGKTFENTVDSLRDFIIALDKEKADRLRYKVEDDVVRIFITPYRTTITRDDLDFSQGDFNVELVVALGVEKKDDLDMAITAHGRILHDATVVTINSGDSRSDLGTIDWHDNNASSLCEMLMSLSEALQSGLLDEQISTSLLTGIVAATERFSNPHTSPKVMTMAAQLMAAGANQQLIAARLQEGHELPASVPATPAQDGSKKLQEGDSAKLKDEPLPAPKKDGEMTIEHDPEPQSPVMPPIETVADTTQDTDTQASTEQLLPQLPPTQPTISLSDLQKDLAEASREVDQASTETPSSVFGAASSEPDVSAPVADWRDKIIDPPSLGGTLSATATEAEEAKAAEERSSRNHMILSHDGPGNGSQSVSGSSDEPPRVDPFAEPLHYEESPMPEAPLASSKARTIMPVSMPPVTDTSVIASSTPSLTPSGAPTLEELEKQAHAHAEPAPEVVSSLDEARDAVSAALDSPQPLVSQPAPIQPPIAAPEPLSPQASEPTLPPPPPMPDFSQLPPLPPMPGEQAQPSVPHPAADPAFPMSQDPEPTKSDPGQFRIPGQ